MLFLLAAQPVSTLFGPIQATVARLDTVMSAFELSQVTGTGLAKYECCFMPVTARRPQPGRPHELQGRCQVRAVWHWHWCDGLTMPSAPRLTTQACSSCIRAARTLMVGRICSALFTLTPSERLSKSCSTLSWKMWQHGSM